MRNPIGLSHRVVANFELKAELAKEINRPSEVIDDDSYVVHPFERHLSNLQGVVWSHDRLFLQRVSRTLT